MFQKTIFHMRLFFAYYFLEIHKNSTQFQYYENPSCNPRCSALRNLYVPSVRTAHSRKSLDYLRLALWTFLPMEKESSWKSACIQKGVQLPTAPAWEAYLFLECHIVVFCAALETCELVRNYLYYFFVPTACTRRGFMSYIFFLNVAGYLLQIFTYVFNLY